MCNVHESADESSFDAVISEENAIAILKVTLIYSKFISALKSLFYGNLAMKLKVPIMAFRVFPSAMKVFFFSLKVWTCR